MLRLQRLVVISYPKSMALRQNPLTPSRNAFRPKIIVSCMASVYRVCFGLTNSQIQPLNLLRFGLKMEVIGRAYLHCIVAGVRRYGWFSGGILQVERRAD